MCVYGYHRRASFAVALIYIGMIVLNMWRQKSGEPQVGDTCLHSRGSDPRSSLAVPLAMGAMLQACLPLGRAPRPGPPSTSPPPRSRDGGPPSGGAGGLRWETLRGIGVTIGPFGEEVPKTASPPSWAQLARAGTLPRPVESGRVSLHPLGHHAEAATDVGCTAAGATTLVCPSASLFFLALCAACLCVRFRSPRRGRWT